MSIELERLRTVEPYDTDGGLGTDVQWAVAEIERLQAVVDAVKACNVTLCNSGRKCIAIADSPIIASEFYSALLALTTCE